MIFIIKDIVNSSRSPSRPLEYDESFTHATNLVYKATKQGSLALVYGPPGTGKTTVYEDIISKLVETMSEGEKIIYIAPTNQLLADMLKRVVTVYSGMGKSEHDLKKELRLFGSQFDYTGFERLRDKVDNATRLILTTDYQSVSKLFTQEQKLHIMIDEASKSPLHTPFIPLAQHLINHSDTLFASFSVIGDPNQAVGVGDEYKGRRDLLLLPRLTVGLLKRETGQELEGVYDNMQDLVAQADRYLKKHFALLKLTYRLPSPTEQPISKGYYAGLLHAKTSAQERLHDIWDNNTAVKLANIDESMKKVVKVLDEAITTNRALVYFETTEKSYSEYSSILFDRKRAEIGLYSAVALTKITNEPVSVITPYVDQTEQMKQIFYRDFRANFPRLSKLLRFNTIHRMLGSESDHVIAILGKEYTSDEPTIYFSEPELLNVQLSRHRKIMIIIGNLLRLSKTIAKVHQKERTTRYDNLRKTAETVFNLCGCEIKGNRVIRGDGDGGLYHSWKD